uniref:Uncharacterized protein n=1 Tax=Globodera rostochiensis TaxID=31243 RepID=A0A914HC17_GLORO
MPKQQLPLALHTSLVCVVKKARLGRSFGTMDKDMDKERFEKGYKSSEFLQNHPNFSIVCVFGQRRHHACLEPIAGSITAATALEVCQAEAQRESTSAVDSQHEHSEPTTSAKPKPTTTATLGKAIAKPKLSTATALLANNAQRDDESRLGRKSREGRQEHDTACKYFVDALEKGYCRRCGHGDADRLRMRNATMKAGLEESLAKGAKSTTQRASTSLTHWRRATAVAVASLGRKSREGRQERGTACKYFVDALEKGYSRRCGRHGRQEHDTACKYFVDAPEKGYCRRCGHRDADRLRMRDATMKAGLEESLAKGAKSAAQRGSTSLTQRKPAGAARVDHHHAEADTTATLTSDLGPNANDTPHDILQGNATAKPPKPTTAAALTSDLGTNSNGTQHGFAVSVAVAVWISLAKGAKSAAQRASTSLTQWTRATAFAVAVTLLVAS